MEMETDHVTYAGNKRIICDIDLQNKLFDKPSDLRDEK